MIARLLAAAETLDRVISDLRTLAWCAACAAYICAVERTRS